MGKDGSNRKQEQSKAELGISWSEQRLVSIYGHFLDP